MPNANEPPLIFVVSPLAPSPEDPFKPPEAFLMNRQFAEMRCFDIAMAGGIPYAPHAFCTHFLDDRLSKERDLGIRIGRHMLARADEVWVALPYWRQKHSTGMLGEIRLAEDLGKKINFFGSFRDEANKAAWDIALQYLTKRLAA